MTPLLIALAGGLGAVARFVVDGIVARHNPLSFPLGTVVINVTGSLLLGLLTGAVIASSGSDEVQLILGTCSAATPPSAQPASKPSDSPQEPAPSPSHSPTPLPCSYSASLAPASGYG